MNSSTSNSDDNEGSEGDNMKYFEYKISMNKVKRLLNTQCISWGLVGVIILLLLTEIFVFRNNNFYGMKASSVGQFEVLNKSWSNTKKDMIETIILGDSTGIDGMRPEIIAEQAGVNRESIFNFSISGGKSFEIYHTYKKYSNEMPNLKRAFIVVNEHQFNNINFDKQSMFKYYAGLNDRFATMTYKNYGDLLLGYFLKAYEFRSEWSDIINTLFNSKKRNELHYKIPLYSHGLPALHSIDDGDFSTNIARKTADRWFEDYKINGLETNSFNMMIKDLRENGIKVIIVRLPRTEVFEEVIQNNYSAEEDRFLKTVSSIAEQHNSEFEIIPNNALQTNINFRDPIHLNDSGSRWLAKYISEKWFN